MTTELSLATSAVLGAFTEDNCLHDWKHNHYNVDALAAALRAVADSWQVDTECISGVEYIRTSTLRNLAAELERSTRVR